MLTYDKAKEEIGRLYRFEAAQKKVFEYGEKGKRNEMARTDSALNAIIQTRGDRKYSDDADELNRQWYGEFKDYMDFKAKNSNDIEGSKLLHAMELRVVKSSEAVEKRLDGISEYSYHIRFLNEIEKAAKYLCWEPRKKTPFEKYPPEELPEPDFVKALEGLKFKENDLRTLGMVAAVLASDTKTIQEDEKKSVKEMIDSFKKTVNDFKDEHAKIEEANRILAQKQKEELERKRLEEEQRKEELRRQQEEEKRKQEEERRHIEEENRRQEEERHRQEEERHRQEEERRHAEEQKRLEELRQKEELEERERARQNDRNDIKSTERPSLMFTLPYLDTKENGKLPEGFGGCLNDTAWINNPMKADPKVKAALEYGAEAFDANFRPVMRGERKDNGNLTEENQTEIRFGRIFVEDKNVWDITEDWLQKQGVKFKDDFQRQKWMKAYVTNAALEGKRISEDFVLSCEKPEELKEDSLQYSRDRFYSKERFSYICNKTVIENENTRFRGSSDLNNEALGKYGNLLWEISDDNRLEGVKERLSKEKLNKKIVEELNKPDAEKKSDAEAIPEDEELNKLMRKEISGKLKVTSFFTSVVDAWHKGEYLRLPNAVANSLSLWEKAHRHGLSVEELTDDVIKRGLSESDKKTINAKYDQIKSNKREPVNLMAEEPSNKDGFVMINTEDKMLKKKDAPQLIK